MKRSELIKQLLAMPGVDPQVIFTIDDEELTVSKMVPDFDVDIDGEGQPVQVPNYIEIKLCS